MSSGTVELELVKGAVEKVKLEAQSRVGQRDVKGIEDTLKNWHLVAQHNKETYYRKGNALCLLLYI